MVGYDTNSRHKKSGWTPLLIACKHIPHPYFTYLAICLISTHPLQSSFGRAYSDCKVFDRCRSKRQRPKWIWTNSLVSTVPYLSYLPLPPHNLTQLHIDTMLLQRTDWILVNCWLKRRQMWISWTISSKPQCKLQTYSHGEAIPRSPTFCFWHHCFPLALPRSPLPPRSATEQSHRATVRLSACWSRTAKPRSIQEIV